MKRELRDGCSGWAFGFLLKDSAVSRGASQVTSLTCLLNGCVRLKLFTILLCYSSFVLTISRKNDISVDKTRIVLTE